LTSRVQQDSISANTQALAHVQPGTLVQVSLTLRIPKKTKSVRVVMESETGGRVGTAEVGRKAIDDARGEPTPQPKLTLQPGSSAAHPQQQPPAPR
jgi:hypothetical protein